MIYMHCRIRVADYTKWKERMDADAKAQRDAGMYLRYLRRGVEDPNSAFFILEVHDMEKARAFLNPADVAEASKKAGVLDFEWHFVTSVELASPHPRPLPRGGEGEGEGETTCPTTHESSLTTGRISR